MRAIRAGATRPPPAVKAAGRLARLLSSGFLRICGASSQAKSLASAMSEASNASAGGIHATVGRREGRNRLINESDGGASGARAAADFADTPAAPERRADGFFFCMKACVQ